MPRDIPRRSPDFVFEPESIPAGFYAGDPMLSLVPAALSLVFPEGERFFVESVVRYKDEISDPELRQRIADFAAQEGKHSNAHLAFNAMLRAQGLEVFPELERQVKFLLRRGALTHSPAGRLAITCALEHFTAVMAEQLLTNADLREAFHPAVRGLWLWHALEETEHKSVAFDVYEQVDGSYARRAAVMLTTTLFFVGFIALAHRRLRQARGRARDLGAFARTFGHFWLTPGHFRRLLPGYLRYFAPGFHPDGRDASALVREWRERLFGPDGMLREQAAQAA
ncbi:MAG: metal-dependent hydrolase [Sorangiineae bacterium PRO1]|nr:metal-dependent hydrolase [Sorangiineae bacterium PRO1]